MIHAVLQQWSLARWRRTPLDATAVTAAFDLAWTETGEDIAWDDESASKAAALATVVTYLAQTPIPVEERPEAVEVGVEVNLYHPRSAGFRRST